MSSSEHQTEKFRLPSTIGSAAKLDGTWNFAWLGSREDTSEAAWEPVPVPSAFDAMPAHAGKRGRAVYSTVLVAPRNRKILLSFGGISMRATVLVDGEEAAVQDSGYVPFSCVVPAADREERRLDVVVDNRFNFKTTPMHEERYDFYQYGGILRSVTARVLPLDGAHIGSVRILPTANYREGELDVTVFTHGARSAIEAEVQVGGRTVLLNGVSPEGELRGLVRTPDLRLWSPETPIMQSLRVTIGAPGQPPIDEMTVRFGLRQIEARDARLWLNGEPLILRGYNRHEWHPNFGPCTPVLQMAADLQLLRKLGCNFVRGSHYPQDQQFLDLCDAMGFLVWEENLGWGQKEKSFESALFREHHAKSLAAMVRASWNHPCVILWGFLNEPCSDLDICREVFEESVSIIKSLDPTRPVSYATVFVETDRHLDLVDVVSFNIYPGWYCCEGEPAPLDLIAPAVERTARLIDERGFKDKPLIISEIGAEALYGWHEPHNDFYSEEYQAEYLKRAIDAALANRRISGIALWHFSDARTYGGGRSMIRPRTFNNKGTFDEYRRPKAAAKAVALAFARAKPDQSPQ